MLIHGKRMVRTNRYRDHHHRCSNCGQFDLRVSVYQDYFHAYFVPFVPAGAKEVVAQCNACGAPFRLDAMRRHYEDISKPPLYFYSIPIGTLLLIASAMALAFKGAREREFLVGHPTPGHIYRIQTTHENKQAYTFLKIAAIRGNSLILHPNTMYYERAGARPASDDSFNSGQPRILTKAQVRQMFDDDELVPLQPLVFDEETN